MLLFQIAWCFGEDKEGGRPDEWQGQILIPGCHPTMIIIRQKE